MIFTTLTTTFFTVLASLSVHSVSAAITEGTIAIRAPGGVAIHHLDIVNNGQAFSDLRIKQTDDAPPYNFLLIKADGTDYGGLLAGIGEFHYAEGGVSVACHLEGQIADTTQTAFFNFAVPGYADSESCNQEKNGVKLVCDKLLQCEK